MTYFVLLKTISSCCVESRPWEVTDRSRETGEEASAVLGVEVTGRGGWTRGGGSSEK